VPISPKATLWRNAFTLRCVNREKKSPIDNLDWPRSTALARLSLLLQRMCVTDAGVHDRIRVGYGCASCRVVRDGRHRQPTPNRASLVTTGITYANK
jgi:hypothetical protein